MALKDQVNIPGCWQMLYNAETGHHGSILGQWRRESWRGKPFLLIKLYLETQPSAIWKAGEKKS